MSKRFDNRRLLIVLTVLVVILLLTFLLKIPKENSTLRGAVVEFDTSKVARIVFTPKKLSGGSFEFVKGNGIWKVIQGRIVSPPADGAIQNIFRDVREIKPETLAARDKSKWTEFEVTDSLATRLKFLDSKNKILADLLVGKFSYRQMSNPYGGNNVQGTTYIRLNGENEVYSVDGFLALSFGGQFNDWRNKSFIRCKEADILKITFTLPGDSSFVLSKNGKSWFINNKSVDSTSVANYLHSLEYIDGQVFKDGYQVVTNPDYRLTAEGNNMLNFSVKCYAVKDSDEYVLNSSLYPDAYFSSRRNGIFNQVFKPLKQFIKK